MGSFPVDGWQGQRFVIRFRQFGEGSLTNWRRSVQLHLTAAACSERPLRLIGEGGGSAENEILDIIRTAVVSIRRSLGPG